MEWLLLLGLALLALATSFLWFLAATDRDWAQQEADYWKEAFRRETQRADRAYTFREALERDAVALQQIKAIVDKRSQGT